MLTDLLQTTRRRGYGVWHTSQVTNELARLSESTESRADPSRLWAAVARDNQDAGAEGLPTDVSSVQLPVFDADGSVALVIVVCTLQEAAGKWGLAALERRLLDVQRVLSDAVANIA